jgi:Uma2 family endonuclease
MPAAAILTSDQYLSLPDEFDQNGNRIKDELIGGEVVKMPPPSFRHDRIKNRIKTLLDRFLEKNQNVAIEVLVEMGTEVSRQDVFVPDVSVIRVDRGPEAERIFRGGPDLAIEVVSPTDAATRLKYKVEAYLRSGSLAVWVVSPHHRSVMVYTRENSHELKDDQTIEDPLLPGFSIPVSQFFNLS